MPHFLLTQTSAGPIIKVWITVSAPRHAALTAAGSPIPPGQLCDALVDTGASNTNIDPTVMNALSLTPTGTANVVTPSTGNVPVAAPTYDIGLHIPLGSTTQQVHSKNPITAISSVLLHQGFAVLLGRDVLADGILIYDGKHNIFTLSF